MSTSHDIKYKCPYCGRDFTITVYDSVNAQSDPDLRERSLSGDLFRHSCPHCKTDFMIQNPLVYSDPEKKFLIWLSNEEATDALASLAKPLDQQGYTLRRCGTIQEFTEKIQIFEDGVSDIVAELAKYDSFIEFIDSRNGNPADVTSVEYQKTEDGVMKINVRTDDKGLSFLIPTAMLEEEIRAQSDRYEAENTSFPRINSDWLISLFTESDGQA
jgi:hypothetical protein